MQSQPTVPGLDLRQLAAWLTEAVPGAGAGEVSAQLIAGGKSNLTYVVRRGDWTGVIRRPPLGHVLATAHDMAREYRVLSALRDSVVPVPRVIGICPESEVIGVPFYVMQFVEGVTYRQAAELSVRGTEHVRHVCESLVDTLATLHGIDPAAVGLTDFGRPDGYLLRQVHRWKKQLDASQSRELLLTGELYSLLLASVPESSRMGIVHGDYRLDNVLVDGNGGVAAVLDWEMATLGDPVSDLALMLVYCRLSTSPAAVVTGDAPCASGFLSHEQLIDRYARSTGSQLPALGFHLGLASFKLAAILEGIHFRHQQGKTVGAGFDQVGTAVEPLLEAGLAALKAVN